MKTKTQKPPSLPITAPEKSIRVRVSGVTGEYCDASVIRVWRRGEVAYNPDDGPFKMRDAAAALFNASPSIVRVAYLWTGRCFLFLGGDNHGQWFDVTAQPVRLEILEGVIPA